MQSNKKQYSIGFDLADIEDAILQGQEQFIEIMAQVQGEYLAPLMDQMMAMQFQSMTPEQQMQVQAQMQQMTGGQNAN